MNPFLAALAVIVVTFLLATGIPKKTPAKTAIHTETVQSSSPSATMTPTQEMSEKSATETPTPSSQQHQTSQGTSSNHTSVTINGKTIEPDANGNVNYDDGHNSVHVNGSSSSVQSNSSSNTTINTSINTSVNTGNQ